VKVQRIAVLTSGGDAPGMNAAIRAVVRMANFQGIQTYGVMRGYRGLLGNDFVEMVSRSVSNIIQRGGTILKTSRSKEFKTAAGLKKASKNLERHKIDGLVVIGGDGSYRGAIDLAKVWPGQIIGVPGTIDNDLFGTDATIGYDTAINTALDAIDKIRDTAEAHERFFLVEVMGRHSGFISLEVGIGGGAEEILIPETKTSLRAVCDKLDASHQKGKTSSIIIVAEGDEEGGAFEVAGKLKKMSGHEYRVVVLGHLQRGGSPTAADRRLATELGAYAVERLQRGASGVAVGRIGCQRKTTSLRDTCRKKKKLDAFLLRILPALAI